MSTDYRSKVELDENELLALLDLVDEHIQNAAAMYRETPALGILREKLTDAICEVRMQDLQCPPEKYRQRTHAKWKRENALDRTELRHTTQQIRRKFQQTQQNDPLVASLNKLTEIGIHENDALKAVVVDLCIVKENMTRELVRLESIAPKLIRMPDGTVMRYDAPDRLIPITDREKPESETAVK